MSIGQCITSPSFKSGGYHWAINIYPKGRHKREEDVYASFFLKLLNDHEGLKVSFSLAILERGGTQGMVLLRIRSDYIFNSENDGEFVHSIRRTILEERYLTNGFFVVLCTINIHDKLTDELPQQCSCGLLGDTTKLLIAGKMAGVKFEVEGEIFFAHKLILGATSPVFRAELFGYVLETRMEHKMIKDMKSEVFKALLHFVYTCSLPNDAYVDMIQHLLLAADRYAIEGLIIRCQKMLIENISLDKVLRYLICAERHNFKNGCLEFITQRENFVKLALTEEYFEM